MAEDLSKLKIDKSPGTAKKRRKKPFFWISAIAIVLVALGVLYEVGFLRPSVEVETTTVSLVYPSQTFTLLNGSGYVVAQRKAAIASKATGKIVSLVVEEGNRVKKGQVIARLENDDVLASQKQARANLETARSNLETVRAELNDATLAYGRGKRLFESNLTARADLDTSEARYKKAIAAVAGAESAIKAANAAVEWANAAVDYTLIKVPFDGVVLTKNADIGDIVTPLGAAANAKAAVVTIADMDSLQVECDVSESSLSKVRIGQPCELQLDALPDTRLRGVVHMIVPTADRSKATVMVKVRFLEKDPKILPEMSAKVAFLSKSLEPAEQKPVTGVVGKAIIGKGERKVVFLVKGDRVVETPVTTGVSLGNMIEITSGVKAGDKIVLQPLEKLRNGSVIKVKEG